MHPEAEALLNAIYDHPDDDTPRLVYADWLQEHGQENYAQFIRLQCAAAREQLWSAEANRLWEEIGRVWNRLYYEWLPAMQLDWGPDSAQYQLDAVHFHRGFLTPNLRLTSEHLAFAECWKWLPARMVDLELTNNSAELFALCASNHLQRISRVRVNAHVPANDLVFRDALNAFLSHPALCNLEMLHLGLCTLAVSTLAVLLNAPNLVNVQRVYVCFSLDVDDGSPIVADFENALSDLEKRFPSVGFETY